MNKFIINGIMIFLIFFAYSGCSSPEDIYRTAFPTLVDGRYDSEFPNNSSSEQLEEIGNTVKMVNTLCFYSSHTFPLEANITLESITDDLIDQNSESVTFFNHTASGTATVITSTFNSITLLTCAHIVSFPDRIVSYYPNDMGGYSDKIQSVAIKEKQTIWVIGLPERGEVDLLITDDELDVAILGKQYKHGTHFSQSAFNYPIGEAKELVWGSFVYVFGYPLNYKMITKGIVSSPNRNNNGSFLLDAVFNKGYSGGIVLAIRDGVPNFEIVGMVKSVPSDVEYYLKPATTEKGQEINPAAPYTGQIYADKRQNMKYGITKVIPIESIIKYIKDNESKLSNLGYSLDPFVNR